jgi:hypothetical protein
MLATPLHVSSRWVKAEIPRPGGYLDPIEDDKEGLSLRLQEQLGIPHDRSFGTPLNLEGTAVLRANEYVQPEWKVTDLLGVWWRPHFDTYFVSMFYGLLMGYTDDLSSTLSSLHMSRNRRRLRRFSWSNCQRRVSTREMGGRSSSWYSTLSSTHWLSHFTCNDTAGYAPSR